MAEYIVDIPKNDEQFMKRNQRIIRCIDCKYSEHWYGDKRICFLWHESGIDVFNDGFCNYGKEEDAENE